MILAIDTATRSVGLALHDGFSVVAEATWHTANNHTVELTPALQTMLRQTATPVSALTAIVVTLGPGSYTGLRIGMSLAKGIALAASPPLPIVGVPTLDVVAAAQPHRAERLCAVAQAGRKRINAGFYEWRDEAWQPAGEPFITTWDDLIDGLDVPTQIAGEIGEQARDLLATTLGKAIPADPAHSLRRAGYLAELGLRRLRAGAAADPAALAPTYLS